MILKSLPLSPRTGISKGVIESGGDLPVRRDLEVLVEGVDVAVAHLPRQLGLNRLRNLAAVEAVDHGRIGVEDRGGGDAVVAVVVGQPHVGQAAAVDADAAA